MTMMTTRHFTYSSSSIGNITQMIAPVLIAEEDALASLGINLVGDSSTLVVRAHLGDLFLAANVPTNTTTASALCLSILGFLTVRSRDQFVLLQDSVKSSNCDRGKLLLLTIALGIHINIQRHRKI